MIASHVIQVLIDIITPLVVLIIANVIQGIMMMALMKNATLARLKRITLIIMENVGIVIILGK